MNARLDKNEAEKTISRINTLTSQTEHKWGKMKAAQMLAHCRIGLETAMGAGENKQHLMGKLVGWMAKKMIFTDKPWKPNMPTDKNFIVTGERNFEEEKQKLVSKVREFAALGPERFQNCVHPFFGKLKPDEWNILQHKHLDHHLRQFGV